MDRIEELMKVADPARDAPGPRPFHLAEVAGPSVASTARRRGRRDHLAVWGSAVGAAAALAGGLVIAHEWRTAPDTPAPPAGSGAGEGSAPATTSPDPAPAPTDLPNGLVPAHDQVYLEDSDACAALDVTQVLTQGDRALATEPWEYPVVGCVDGIAALTMSDRAVHAAGLDDVVTGVVLARWQDGRWAVEDPRELDGGQVAVPVYHSWPALLGYQLPGDPPAAERMAEQYAQIGVDAGTGERLLGPETTAWTVDTPAGSWTPGAAGPAEFSWRSDATWAHDELSGAAAGGGAEDVRHEVVYFDPRGRSVARLVVTTSAEQAGCALTDATYVVEGRRPTGLRSQLGSLDVGLVTAEDVLGVEVSTTRLVPSSAPDSGASCDLPEEHLVGDVAVRLDGGRYQFRTAQERGEYLATQEYADVVRLAASVELG